jgi:acetyltransferase-like isoleucine patch superfamily enzyme
MLKIFRNTMLSKALGFLRFLLCKSLSRQAQFYGVGLIGANNTFCVKGRSEFGNKFITANSVEIIALGRINTGDNVFINSYSRIVSHEEIVIGNNVTIAQHVSILDHDHGYIMDNGSLRLDGYCKKSIEIGSNVWIGDKVSILKGVEIGSNVIIGANSVVNKSIPSNSIAAGFPAKVIKKLK